MDLQHITNFRSMGNGQEKEMVCSAAFERLCVETTPKIATSADGKSAAFERLCVETSCSSKQECKPCSAAFERLCVETGQ